LPIVKLGLSHSASNTGSVVFKKRVMRKISRSKSDEVTREYGEFA
jgi:hypothetical protein